MSDDITPDGITQVPIYHTYEMTEPRLPQAGDKALCGYVLQSNDPMPSGLLPFWGQTCVVCEELDAYWDWVIDGVTQEGRTWG